MSVSGLGAAGFGNPVAELLGLGAATATKKSGTAGAADEAAAKAEAAQAKQAAVLKEIREKGIYAWAQEQKLAKLEARARQQVLEERGLTEQDLAKMPEGERDATEASIQEVIAQLVKDAMAKNMAHKSAADADGQTPTGPMIIDISV